uniref:Uncharacterized protein n=1 Tax=Cacopsylla melanoneura TaxID=428564 RepID=A0A8D8U841_9HEMI
MSLLKLCSLFFTIFSLYLILQVSLLSLYLILQASTAKAASSDNVKNEFNKSNDSLNVKSVQIDPVANTRLEYADASLADISSHMAERRKTVQDKNKNNSRADIEHSASI